MAIWLEYISLLSWWDSVDIGKQQFVIFGGCVS